MTRHAKRLRVVLLHYQYPVPEEIQGFYVLGQVEETIRDLCHEVRPVGLADDLRPLRATLDTWKPHVVFNQLVSFRGVVEFDSHVGAYLELLGMPYVGCNSKATLLARDKALCKTILSYHGIPTPQFFVARIGEVARVPPRMEYPLIVKAARGWGSEGIAQASVVRNARQLERRVDLVHRRVGADALVETYVPGRELTVGVIGNRRLRAFPVWEMFFEHLPRGSLPFQTEKVKWDRAYRQRYGIRSGPADPMDWDLERRIQRMAKDVYRRLQFSGYARIDLRLTDGGRLFVLDANPYPGLSRGGRFASPAAASGLPYPVLIQRLLTIAMHYRPPWAHTVNGTG